MASPPSDIRRHERFYFSDGSLCLLVENLLYRVHRSLFEIHANNFPACGLNEIHFLANVKKIDFDRLLACLYPRALLVAESSTAEEWISILNLASRWGFEALHARAISEIERLASSVDMVILGRQHDIPDILLLGYVALCQGTTPLSFEDGHRLGVDDVINIYRIRQELSPFVMTSVSFEEILEKLQILLQKKERKDGQESEAKRPDLDPDAPRPVILTADRPERRVVGSNEQPGSSKPLSEKEAETADSVRNKLAYVERSGESSGLVSEREQSDVNIVSLLSETPPDSPLSGETPEDQLGLVSEQEQSDMNTVSLILETPLDSPLSRETPEDQLGLVSEQEQSDMNIVSLILETPLDSPLSGETPEDQLGLVSERTQSNLDTVSPPQTSLGHPSYTDNGPESEEELLDESLFGGEAILNTPSNRNGVIPVFTFANVPGSWGSASQVFRFFDELTANNFKSIVKDILRWFKTTPNSQMLHLFTQLIIESAIAEQTTPGQFNILVRLCKEMSKRLTGIALTRHNSAGIVFRDNLGDLCCENLKIIPTSAIDMPVVRSRRVRLIEFIRNLANIKGIDLWTPEIVDRWVTALLDSDDEERVTTLWMLMTHVGPCWETKKKKKLRNRMGSWFERMDIVAQRTSNICVRGLLQDVIRHRSHGWMKKWVHVWDA